MSSHHNRKFFLTKYDQQDKAKARRVEKALERQATHEAQVKLIYAELKRWRLAEALVYVGVLLSFGAIAQFGIWQMFR